MGLLQPLGCNRYENGNYAASMRTAVVVTQTEAESLVMERLLLRGATVETLEKTTFRTVPLHNFAGRIVNYLAISTTGEMTEPMAFIESLSEASAAPMSISVSLVGAATDAFPVSSFSSSAKQLLEIKQTMLAIGGRQNVKRLMPAGPLKLLIEAQDGSVYLAGCTTPLSPEQLSDYRTSEQKVEAALAEHAADMWESSDRVWSEVSGNVEIGALETDGHLDGKKLAAELRKDGNEAALREQSVTPAETEALVPTTPEPSVTEGKNPTEAAEHAALGNVELQAGEQYSEEVCEKRVLGACVRRAKWESARFSTGTNARAVGHRQGSHRNKNVPVLGTVLTGNVAVQTSYSGGGPESFAALAWRRYKNGDDAFGYERSKYKDIPDEASLGNDADTVMQPIANDMTFAMDSRALDSSSSPSILTYPWKYKAGANDWLAKKKSPLRVEQSLSHGPGNILPWNTKDKANVLRRLVGGERGPVVMGGYVGDPGRAIPNFTYHYTNVFAYRVLWKKFPVVSWIASDVIVDITRAETDFDGAEVSLADWRTVYAGLWYFADDLARPARGGEVGGGGCAGKADGGYCDSSEGALNHGYVCSAGALKEGSDRYCSPEQRCTSFDGTSIQCAPLP